MRPQLLIIEDERDLLDTLYYNFKKENYDVYTASSGEEAIEIIDRQEERISKQSEERSL